MKMVKAKENRQKIATLEPIAETQATYTPTKNMQFSILFFSSNEAEFTSNKYYLLTEAAQYADQHDFEAVWLPERHFHAFGGLYPNPSVVASALAMITKKIRLRAGSVVIPLHHPVRVAEEWAVVDNLSGGRVDLGFARGWNPNDFIFAPENYQNRMEIMYQKIAEVQKLWQGESLMLPNGLDKEVPIKIYPLPKQKNLNTWVTCSGGKEGFIEAGKVGANVLTALLFQSPEELAEKIRLYRESLAENGFDPQAGHVTLMLHTYVGEDEKTVREQVRDPFIEYLRTSTDLWKNGILPSSKHKPFDQLTERERDDLLKLAFERYYRTSALFGTPESCQEMVEKLRQAGVNEIASLIDFGVEGEQILKGLHSLNRLKDRFTMAPENKTSGSVAQPESQKPVSVPVTHTSAKAHDKKELLKELLRKKAAQREVSYPLSAGQKGLWFIYLNDPQSAAYHQGFSACISQPVNTAFLRDAFQYLVDRHACLRTTFSMEEDTPMQKVHTRSTVQMHETDASGWDDETLKLAVETAHQKPFALETEAGFRVHLFMRSTTESVLLLTVHHIVTDGWSLLNLVEEFKTLYTTRTLELPPLKTSYADFVGRESAMLTSAAGETHWQYWNGQLSDEIQPLNLPTDYPRPAVQTYNGASVHLPLPDTLLTQLRDTATHLGVTLHHLLMAAYQVLLHKYSGQNDILVGTPAANRNPVTDSSLVGYFVNMVVVRGGIEPKSSFTDFLAKISRTIVTGLTHQDFPFSHIVERLQPDRDLSRHPIFQACFVLQSLRGKEDLSPLFNPMNDNPVHWGDLTLRAYDIGKEEGQFDLTLEIIEEKNSFCGAFKYNRDLFSTARMEQLAQHFQNLLERIVTQPDAPICELSVLSDADYHELMHVFNDTVRDFSSQATMHSLFETQVLHTPHQIALKQDHHTLTYNELNQKANQLAHFLLGKGIQPADNVALVCDRSFQMVISLLAILKAGAAYVPVDPIYPTDRQAYILDNSKASLLLSDQRYEICEQVEEGKVVLLPELDLSEYPTHNPAVEINPEQLAYTIYTSGSTGRPKGVMIAHQSAVNLIEWVNTTYQINTSDKLLFITSMCFDLSVYDIFGSLAAGATVVIAHQTQVENVVLLEELIRTEGITFWDSVPTTLNLLISEMEHTAQAQQIEKQTSLRLVFLSGDWIPVQLPQRTRSFFPNAEVISLGGATEGTVWSNFYPTALLPEPLPVSIPYGRPLTNNFFYILDAQQKPVPLGVVGELYIGGIGVAQGYANDEEKTAASFFADPFHQELGGRMYRTGDLGRMRSDYQMEFIGRKDHQVKVRGFRVELGEIKNTLLRHEQIESVHIVARKTQGSGNELIGYYTRKKTTLLAPKGQTGFREEGQATPLPAKEGLGVVDTPGDCEALQNPDTLTTPPYGHPSLKKGGEFTDFSENDIRVFLSESLPDYMVPAWLVELQALPLTSNGKVDAAALPAPETRVSPSQQATFQTPQTQAEQLLVSLFETVLGREAVSTTDNFFQIGGDSIKAIQIASRLYKAGYKLEVRQLFRYPTIGQLAAHLKPISQQAQQTPVQGNVELAPIQAGFFQSERLFKHHYNQSVLLQTADSLDGTILRNVCQHLQTQHDALRITYTTQAKRVHAHNQDTTHPISVDEYHWTDLELPAAQAQLTNVCQQLQASFDLTTGPLLKMALFHLADGDRLFLCAHHLTIDGVSWRILLEDLEAFYQTLADNQPLTLPLKTDSYQRWSNNLRSLVPSVEKDRPYWQQVCTQTQATSLPIETIQKGRVADKKELSFTLSATLTEQLLTQVSQAYQTEINDILLTALLLACQQVFNRTELALVLESHGRQTLAHADEQPDVSRTMGWFTAQFPVQLSLQTEEISLLIRTIKEQLRQIPSDGISYGLLRYLTPKADASLDYQADVCFNYLGQFDTDLTATRFRPASEETGLTENPAEIVEYALEILGMVRQQQLVTQWIFDSVRLSEQTIAELATAYEQALEQLILHCTQVSQPILTPSDLTFKGLSIEKLDALTQQVAVEDVYTLSPMQEGMLFHSLLDADSSAYFEQLRFRFTGNLSLPHVTQGLTELARRHAILRTAVWHQGTDQPLQIVVKDRTIPCTFHDLTLLDRPLDKEGHIQIFAEKDRQRGFDLHSDSLMRVSILKTGENEFEFVWSYHHFVMDGWSLGILAAEFFQLYQAFSQQKDAQLLPAQPYRDYIQWLSTQDKTESLTYWKNYLTDFEQVSVIPGRKTTQATSYQNQKLSFVLPDSLQRKIQTLAGTHQITLNTIIQTAWGMLLSKYNSLNDIVFGSVVSGRSSEVAGVESMVGLFINTVPVRVAFDATTTGVQLLQKVQQEVMNGEKHQYFPLAEIQKETVLKQNLLNHIVVFENYPLSAQMAQFNGTGNDMQISNVSVFEQTNYDFNLIVIPGTTTEFYFQFNEAVYDAAVLVQVKDHFLHLLHELVHHQTRRVQELSILTEAEFRKVTADFNQTATAYPCQPVQYLFEAQAEATPESRAVVCDDTTLTYGELNAQANQVAHFLRDTFLIKEDQCVSLIARRSEKMVACLLGILKAGAAYVPIDPSYPADRIAYMLQDTASVVLLLDDESLVSSLNLAPHSYLLLDDVWKQLNDYPTTNPERFNTPADLAYIMYTSGSTGKPKAVMVEHKSIARLVKNTNYVPFSATDRLLQTGALSFDATTFEIWGMLLNGGELHLVPQETLMDQLNLKQAIADRDITMMWFTASWFNQLVDADPTFLKPLQTVLVGGDKLSPRHIAKVRSLYPDLQLINGYGPTENTTFSICHRIDQHYTESVPLGTPIANSTVYIVDHTFQPVPVGVPGEILVGGDGLARGYKNQELLTAEKFIENPFVPGTKLYRTGDIGQWTPDGQVLYLGRKDNQLKIRGYRIELGEIENTILTHPAVEDVVVVTPPQPLPHKEGLLNHVAESPSLRGRGWGGVSLAAYFVATEELSAQTLREFLKTRLPDYMVPSYFVQMEALPLTPNGKVNRRALPAPETAVGSDAATYQAPVTATEQALAEVFSQTLGRPAVSLTDNFFEIGGDSIKAIQISSRLYNLGYRLEVKDLFQHPTIARLAAFVRPLTSIADQSAVSGQVFLTPIQKEFFSTHRVAPHHYNQAVLLHCTERLDTEVLQRAFNRLYEHHDALRIRYIRENDELLQQNTPAVAGALVQEFDFRKMEYPYADMEQVVQTLQAGMELTDAPLVKVALLRLPDADRLFIVIHHLVVDTVSWRILLEDFEALYQKAKTGQKLNLPLKTTSFQTWAARLNEYASSAELQQEKAYWNPICQAEVSPVLKQIVPNLVKDQASLTFRLTPATTDLLLTKANWAFHTEINDLLLTAFGLAVKNTFGRGKIRIALEGHGREELFADTDISRTVGWFTSVFPVILETFFDYDVDSLYDSDLGLQIRHIKETLRQIPNKGIGYGILRYLTPDSDLAPLTSQPEFSFNYLGQFTQDMQWKLFSMASESIGDTVAPHEKRPYAFDVVGMVADGQLSITIQYNKKWVSVETIEDLAHEYRDALKKIVSYCTERKEKIHSPSDFTFKGLTLAKAEDLSRRYALQDLYRLSPMQEGMLFTALMDSQSAAYFEQLSFQLNGSCDITLLQKAFEEICHRHDVFRTVFLYEDTDRPVQLVLPHSKPDIHIEDLRHLTSRDAQRQYIEQAKNHDKQRLFNLQKGPLVRMSAFVLDTNHVAVVWSFHHILLDGWSLGIVMQEFFRLYSSLLAQQPVQLPGVRPYRTYIQWLSTQNREQARAYWKTYLNGYEQPATLPRLKARLAEETAYAHREQVLTLTEKQTAALEAMARQHQVTLNTVIQAVWGVLLHKYGNNRDVVFGTVVSGRPATIPGVETMVGLFINTVPVRVSFDTEQTFAELLTATHARLVQSEPYHYFPLSEIQSQSELGQNLLDHILVFENYPVSENTDGLSPAVRVSDVSIFEQTNYDFNVIVLPGKQLEIKCVYNEQVYDTTWVSTLQQHFGRLLEEVTTHAKTRISEVSILSEGEYHELMHVFNDTVRDFSSQATMHSLFETQVLHTPHQIALKQDEQTLTYNELNQKANQLAHYLLEKGIQPADNVALVCDRSFQMVISLLAILKAGAAYVPVDPIYPTDRQAYILDNSKASLLLSDQRYEICEQLEEAKVVLLPELDLSEYPTHNPAVEIAPEQLAYTIYTSGSTGRPKGVMIAHTSAVNLIEWVNATYQINTSDKLLFITSMCFDLSVYDIFGSLAAGATVVIAHQSQVENVVLLEELIRTEGITFWDSVPTTLNLLVSEMEHTAQVQPIEKQTSLRLVFLSGDWIAVQLPQRTRCFFPNAQVISLGGATEGTVWSNFYPTALLPEPLPVSIPYGRPLTNNFFYILDAQQKPVPLGVVGELYIGGIGVAMGYANDEEKTAASFFADPFHQELGGRMYRTGDLGRMRSDYQMEFIGRKDHQVKVRGFRVELGEIKNTLLRHEQIESVHIVARKVSGSGNELIGYYTRKKTTPLASEDETGAAPEAEFTDFCENDIRAFLSESLPDYMVPAWLVELQALPLTSNGKVDAAALPAPETRVSLSQQATFQTPQTQAEQLLVSLFETVLGREAVSTTDNFFQIGGDSIKAIQIASRLYKAGYKLEVRQLFRYPTIGQLAAHLKPISQQAQQTPIRGSVELSPIQQAFLGSDRLAKHHYNQALLLQSAQPLQVAVLREVLVQLQTQHDALRMVYLTEKDQIIQLSQDTTHPVWIEEYDWEDMELSDSQHKLTQVCTEIQASLDLATGPLFKTALFHLADGDRLFLCAHHLIMDGVSWRILLEDLEAFYQALSNHESLTLPLKTDSYQRWSENLRNLVPVAEADRSYWQQVCTQTQATTLPALQKKAGKVSDKEEMRSTLSAALTEQLLTQVSHAYQTEINDILLTALLLACQQVFNRTELALVLESHGRQTLAHADEQPDVSRTIGWFTAQFPLRLSLQANELSMQIRTVKEQLRQIPSEGISYGLLRYLTPKADASLDYQADVCFNYLGQVDADLTATQFRLAQEEVGLSENVDETAEYTLEVLGMVEQQQLTIRWVYDSCRLDAETITDLSEAYLTALQQIIAHCIQADQTTLTPSDLSFKDISIEELENFFD